MIPRLIINFKNYRNATGENALKLAKIVEKVSGENDVLIGICVNALELALICKTVKIPVYLQHADYVSFGAHNGTIVPELAKFYGASGVIINHIEKPLIEDQIQKTILECKKHGLKSLVCVESVEEAKNIRKFSPDILLLEHCEYMGSCVSITEHKPEIIEEASRLFGKYSFMIGAGVSQKKHIKTALDRGAFGVIISSAVVNSLNPEEKLKELIQPIKEFEGIAQIK